MAKETAAQPQMSSREQRRVFNQTVYRTNIPRSEDVKLREEELSRQQIVEQAIQSGKSRKEAEVYADSSGIGSSTPNLDKAAFAQSQAGAPSDLGRFKTYGDKSTFDTQQALRKLRGEAPLAVDQQDFSKQLELSGSFKEKSALLTDTGKARAYQSGIAAGLNPADAKSQVEAAADVLRQSLSKAKEQAPAPVAAIPQPSGPTRTAEMMATGYNKSLSGKPAVAAAPKSVAARVTNIPSPVAQEEVEKGVLDAIPNVAGAANVMGKAATTGVAKVGEAATKATEQAAKAAVPRLGSGAMTASEEAAAVLNQARDVAKANLAAKEAGILSRLAGPASAIGKYAGVLGKVGGRVDTAKELYQAGRFIIDDKYRDEAIKNVEALGERGLKAFGPEGTLSDKASYVGESLMNGQDKLKTLFSLGAMQTENRRTGERAAESAKNLTNAQKLQSLRLAERKKVISDEDFAKLPSKERIAISRQLGISSKFAPK
jgi:hypothetical protein